MQKKTEGEVKIARCTVQGLSPLRLYPRPDDILLGEATLKIHTPGPRSADEAIPHEVGALLRDGLLANLMFDEKSGKVATIECDGMRSSVAGVLGMLIEKVLPPSFQRDDRSTSTFLMDLRSLGKQQLQERIETLTVQVNDAPPTIAERLDARRDTAEVLDHICKNVEKMVVGFAEKSSSTD